MTRRIKYFLLIVFAALTTLAKAQTQTTIILVRHAEKEASASADPGLSAAGKARAAALERMLREVVVDRVFSTPYTRTRETVAPLARKRGLDVQIYDPSKQADFAAALKGFSGQTILVSGHSNTVPGLINRLTGERKYQNLAEDEYDNLYIVTLSGDAAKVICLQYGAE